MSGGSDSSSGPHNAVQVLYIFPHAGGTAKSYVPFARAFSTDVKRIAVQYPGRADGHDVQDIGSIPALAAEVYKTLASAAAPDAPVAFFGHSMGAFIAFEVARKFEESGKPIAALFVSASPAPGQAGYEYLHQGSDADLLKMVTDMTGTDSTFIDGKFGATVLRTLRNYGTITSYECPPGTTVSCPIYAYAADQDAAVSYDSVAAWSEFTTADFAITTLSGDHFYVTETVGDLVDDIERRLGQIATGGAQLPGTSR